jgi:hypothetical protein
VHALDGYRSDRRSGRWGLRYMSMMERLRRLVSPAPAPQQPACDVEQLRAVLALAYALGAQPGLFRERFVADLLASVPKIWPQGAAPRPEIIQQLLDHVDLGAEYARQQPRNPVKQRMQ